MNPNVQELYLQTVRQWPVVERLRLATLILDELTGAARFAPTPAALSAEQRERAQEDLLRHAGAAGRGNPRSADNNRIDANLACEYERRSNNVD